VGGAPSVRPLERIRARAFAGPSQHPMRLTTAMHGRPTPDQAHARMRPRATATAAWDSSRLRAWSTPTVRQLPSHRRPSQAVRATLGRAAQRALRWSGTGAEADKLDRTIQRTLGAHGAVPSADRILPSHRTGAALAIGTRAGRHAIPFGAGQRPRPRRATQRGHTDRALVRGTWDVGVTCQVATPAPRAPAMVRGVDLGMVKLAPERAGASCAGPHGEPRRPWEQARRPARHTIGTTAAPRHLQRRAGRQRLCQQDPNHHRSTRRVATADRTTRTMVRADRNGRRQRARGTGPQHRARPSQWAFGPVRAWIRATAQRAGVRVAVIDPAYTRQRCRSCGQSERRTRTSQAAVRWVVGHQQLPAAGSAARTRARAAGNRPLVSNPCPVQRGAAQAQVLVARGG